MKQNKKIEETMESGTETGHKEKEMIHQIIAHNGRQLNHC